MVLALSIPTDPSADPSQSFAIAAAADQAGLDFLLISSPSSAGGLDPLSLAAALASVTERIGLLAAVDAAAIAPFHLARALATLDLLTGGRAGWLAVFEAVDKLTARERFSEHLDVVCALFDSWEDQALVFDKRRSLFADPNRVHRIAHRGRHFTVDGPLNAPRPIQGRPVIVQTASAAFAGYGDIALVRPGDPIGEAALTLRELTVDLEGGMDAPTFAEAMARRFDSERIDGFLLIPYRGPAAAWRILEELVPAIRDAGFRVGGVGQDLRARLGLARPSNRFGPTPIRPLPS